MDQERFKTSQASRIHDQVEPMLRYVGKLKARMDELGFPETDLFYYRVDSTYDALHQLSTRTGHTSLPSKAEWPRRNETAAPGMDQSKIKTRQAEIIHERIGPMLRYVGELRSRMEKFFLPNDEFFLCVETAYDALHLLTSRTHHLTCKSGVGEPERE
jgi:hypothetical protein